VKGNKNNLKRKINMKRRHI